MSDIVVLWRVCAVWDRKRSILRLSAALIIATIGLNLVNIIDTAILHTSWGTPGSTDYENIVEIYGQSPVGLAAVFMSLASNICATTLVGFKVWLHRRQMSEFAQSHGRRSLTIRVMELLVDSGVVYTAIWVLYCTSYFKRITVDYVYEAVGDGIVFSFASTVDHLNAAMAQITSIYPLSIFILVVLDKIHHSRGPQLLSHSSLSPVRPHTAALTIIIEADAGRDADIHAGSSHSTNDAVHDGVSDSCGEVKLVTHEA
ncbi:unnamed protein product [Peniophora sp. CBMAI 1063]|nr:unnamed protein product [Peniophora sp. CBMAI 1063]